tara:strand:+ start:1828 stop:3042 length:1215 start_codon:yes stop_codon:yes gene_type:complete
MKISFSPPRIDQKTIEEVKETLLSGWITTGPKTKLFEDKLAKFIGVKEVVCLNSGTAGLQMAMNWLGIKDGDEVIVPAYTYCATANVVLQFGAKPIMVDINLQDFNIDTSKIKKLITEKTKAIVGVDLAGFPADYIEIKKIVNTKEIRDLYNCENDIQKKLGRIAIISDAAHSIGAEYYGEKTGNHADMSSFSFHAVKNLTTAEGGALALNLPDNFDEIKIKKYFKTLSVHGQSKDALTKNLAGSWEYDVIHPGFKCNMTDINAAIGLVELDRYIETLKKRKDIFKLYDQILKTQKWAILPIHEDQNKKSSCHIYMLRIKDCSEEQRNNIIIKMAQKEIAVNVHYKPLPMLTLYKKLNYNINDFPISYACYSNEISLPVYYDLKFNEVEFVANSIISIINEELK